MFYPKFIFFIQYFSVMRDDLPCILGASMLHYVISRHDISTQKTNGVWVVSYGEEMTVQKSERYFKIWLIILFILI